MIRVSVYLQLSRQQLVVRCHRRRLMTTVDVRTRQVFSVETPRIVFPELGSATRSTTAAITTTKESLLDAIQVSWRDNHCWMQSRWVKELKWSDNFWEKSLISSPCDRFWNYWALCFFWLVFHFIRGNLECLLRSSFAIYIVYVYLLTFSIPLVAPVDVKFNLRTRLVSHLVASLLSDLIHTLPTTTVTSTPAPTTLLSTAAMVTNTSCLPTQFMCVDGTCIDLSARCNGFSDCRDESDERNCTHTIG